jgi:hypothetical protein
MSEQHVTIVRVVSDGFAGGYVDVVFAAMTPDIAWDESEGCCPLVAWTTAGRPS